MTEYKTIPLDKIDVPERLRAVDEDYALTIQASIVEHGLINPITVRFVPNNQKGAKPYILVAGAHRRRAVELNGEAEIEALVIKADADEAQLLEITENLFRNDLSALDRAIAVVTYRETWEQRHGRISRGNPNLRNSVNLTELIADEAKAGFAVYAADRMGVSKAAVERAQRIAQRLIPALRRALRGLPQADNQSTLLKLAGLETGKQVVIADWIIAGNDPQIAIDEALGLTESDKTPASEKAFERVVGNWSRMNHHDKWRALDALQVVDILTDEQKAVLAQRFGGGGLG